MLARPSEAVSGAEANRVPCPCEATSLVSHARWPAGPIAVVAVENAPAVAAPSGVADASSVCRANPSETGRHLDEASAARWHVASRSRSASVSPSSNPLFSKASLQAPAVRKGRAVATTYPRESSEEAGVVSRDKGVANLADA